MKTTITSQDELDRFPNSDRINDLKKMLSQPISVGESKYSIQKLTYDDGISEFGEMVDFPSIEISATLIENIWL